MKKTIVVLIVLFVAFCGFAKTVKVSFVNNNNVIYETTVTSGKTVSDLGRPIQKPPMAKDFIGWSSNGISIFNFATPITEDLVLTAIWEMDNISNHLYVDNNGKLIGISEELKKMSTIVIPSIVTDRFITEIGDCVFMDNLNLLSITIPDSVKVLGGSVFQGCSNLKEVHLPSYMETWGTYLFSGCSDLQNVEIPHGIETIPVSCFRDCKSISSMNIPFGVETIDSFAFSGCSNLEVISLPFSISAINRGFLSRCDNLKRIDMEYGGNGKFFIDGTCLIKKSEYDEAALKYYRSIGYEPSKYALVEAFADENGCIVVPDYVDTIRGDVLNQRSNLKKVLIKASNCKLVEYTITDCPNLVTVEMPSTVAIGANCLSGCPKLDIMLSDISPTTNQKYSVGDIGPAGGYIFYVNQNPEKSSWTYLELAPISFKETVYGFFKNSVKENTRVGSSYGDVGEGAINTFLLTQTMGEDNAYGSYGQNISNYASKQCDDLVLMGFDDWYLPSAIELNYIYDNLFRKGIGNLEEAWYWSSTEYDEEHALARDFSNPEAYVGLLSLYSKDKKYKVCPIRAF